MSISAVSSSAQMIQRPRMAESAERGRENDGDGDDRASVQAQSSSAKSSTPAHRGQVLDIRA